MKAQYDDHGNKFEEDDFGVDVNPVKNRLSGAIRIGFKYNARGDLVAATRFDE